MSACVPYFACVRRCMRVSLAVYEVLSLYSMGTILLQTGNLKSLPFLKQQTDPLKLKTFVQRHPVSLEKTKSLVWYAISCASTSVPMAILCCKV